MIVDNSDASSRYIYQSQCTTFICIFYTTCFCSCSESVFRLCEELTPTENKKRTLIMDRFDAYISHVILINNYYCQRFNNSPPKVFRHSGLDIERELVFDGSDDDSTNSSWCE